MGANLLFNIGRCDYPCILVPEWGIWLGSSNMCIVEEALDSHVLVSLIAVANRVVV